MIVEKFAKKVVSASPFDSLVTIARLMKEHNVGAVVIVDNHRDLALEFGLRGTPSHTQACKVMTSPVRTVHVNDGVFATTQYMQGYKVRRLAVVDDDGWLVGLATLDDLLRVLVRELANLVEGIQSEMAVK